MYDMAARILAGDEDYDQIMSGLGTATGKLNRDMRQINNQHPLGAICAMLLTLAEKKYGESSLHPNDIYMVPAFLDKPRSYVGMTVGPPAQRIICVGSGVKTWEQLFYELAHETLHLLGPTDPKVNPVAQIEEGVAVKFAEEFYDEFVYPVVKHKSYSSPLNASWSVYYKAYMLTRKIPDEVLKDVRTVFGNFKDVESDGLYDLAHAYITEDEARYLSLPFDYNSP